MKTHLFLQALRGYIVERPPVWLMRQAGRYLPQYIALRDKYDFFTRVQTPELACEITLQPIDAIGPDAAILFSDILVVPQAMNLEVQLIESKGPMLPNPIRRRQDAARLQTSEAADRLQYVYDAIRLTKRALNGSVPLIGFAGAPFTILCYMVEGAGSKTFDKTKQLCFTDPAFAQELLASITDVTIAYLKRQVTAGVDALQIFDSWSGILSPQDFKTFAQPHLEKIASELSPLSPVILFPKGSSYALSELSRTGAAALSVDWSIAPQKARARAGSHITLQGNMDPSKLLQPVKNIQKDVSEMLAAFGIQRYIANLGHGLLPHTPVESVQAFVNAVKNYDKI